MEMVGREKGRGREDRCMYGESSYCMLLLAMISLHMLTFRLMVTMVAEFCPLVILIHNTLLGEITISST